ncbi:MAG: DUF2683 family protein [Bacteroidota bacterium]
MTTLTVLPKNRKQLTAIKAVLKALEISFKLDDDTTYLSSTKANKKALDKSIEQAENGQVVKIAIADLWS